MIRHHLACRITRSAAALGMALVLLAAAVPAGAQQSAVDACRAMPSDAERIACLEAALTGPGATQEQPPRGGGLRIPIPFVGGGDRAAGAESITSDAPEAALFGAEQVTAESGAFMRQPPRNMTGQITVVQTDARGLLVMQLDNGQVWRQTERERFPVNIDLSRAEPVEISESGFGGYRMLLLASDRRIRVQRVR